MRNPTGNLNYSNILTKHIVFIYLNYFRNGITSQENKHNPAQKWIKAPQPGIKGDLGSYHTWIQGPPWASLDTKLWEPQQQAASDATLPDPLPFSDISSPTCIQMAKSSNMTCHHRGCMILHPLFPIPCCQQVPHASLIHPLQ